MHTAKVEKRTYKSPDGGKRTLAGVLIFISCLLILAGLLRDNNSGVKLEVKITPTPTVLGPSFDETRATREISLPSKIWYAIQLGSFDSEASAKTQADTFVARGAAGFVYKDSRYRVLAALYPSREEAQTVRQQLQSQHEIDSYVYEIVLPEILLNVEGMAGQLDALEAGLQFLSTTIGKYCESAISMDRQDLSTEQELTRLAEIATQADTLQNVLKQRFASVNYAAVDNLILLLNDVSKAAKSVAEASLKGAIPMASQMKYQTLSLLSSIRTYLNSFSQ